jgi:Cu-Zn family superoxide dismutase
MIVRRTGTVRILRAESGEGQSGKGASAPKKSGGARWQRMYTALQMTTKSWFQFGLFGGSLLLAPVLGAAPSKAPKPVKVTLNQITTDGAGAKAGTVTLRQGKDGVELAIDLSGLTPGEHGFHLHEKGSCDPADKDGKKTAGQAAGAHWDPDATKAHKGPGGGGHKGDLPKLTVPEGGKVKAKLAAAGMTIADFEGKSLMIHAGGDNYSDAPKPAGGGGDRIVCGVVPGGAPAAPAAAAPTAPAPMAAPANKADEKPAAKP